MTSLIKEALCSRRRLGMAEETETRRRPAERSSPDGKRPVLQMPNIPPQPTWQNLPNLCSCPAHSLPEPGCQPKLGDSSPEQAWVAEVLHCSSSGFLQEPSPAELYSCQPESAVWLLRGSLHASNSNHSLKPSLSPEGLPEG